MRIDVDRISKIRVVIYGGGIEGKEFYERSPKAWNNRVKIVGVVDRKEHLDWINPITIEEAKRLFELKEIDGCVITTSNQYKQDIERVLINNGIRILELYNSMPYVSSRTAGVFYNAVTDQLAVYKVKCVYARVDSINNMTWCYTREGILKESFNYPWARNEVKSSVLLDVGYCDEKIEELCVLDRFYSHNYWHFLFEVIEKVIRMEEYGYNGSYLIPDSQYARQYISLMGLDPGRFIFADKSMDCHVFYVSTFYCIDGYKGKERIVAETLGKWADSIAIKVCSCVDRVYPQKIYIKRVESRRIDDVSEKLLIDKGFDCIIAENISVEEQIRFFHMADVVFSPHGACTANSVFMKKGSRLIESFNAKYVNPCCLNVINKKGIHYSMLVSNNETEGHNSDDYSIDPELIETLGV